MVQQVTIPLSALNQVPGVSGVSDVRFDVPQIEDIEAAVDRVTPDLEDIAGEVEAVVQDVLDETGLSDFDPEALAQGIIDEITGEFEDVGDLVSDTIANLLRDVDEGITGLAREVDELDEELQAALAAGGESVELVRFESVFGALREDIARGFEDALDSAIGDLNQLSGDIESLADGLAGIEESVQGLEVPTIDEIQQAVAEALETALGELPGGDLLTDPDGFVDDQFDRLADGLLSDEAEQELLEAVEDLEDSLPGGD